MDFISPSVLAAITGAEQLTAVFGYWPSFHDAEVVRVTLESAVGGRPAALEASLRVFDSSGAVDAQGHFDVTHESLATLRFEDVAALSLEGFYHQNVLFELRIAAASGADAPRRAFEVHFASSVGLELQFSCAAVAVVQVAPWGGISRSGAV